VLIFQCALYGQWIGSDEIDNSRVSPWMVKQTVDYQYVYHFGDSEMESDMVILVDSGKCYAQIKSGSFSKNGKPFIWHYENLTNVRIAGNKYYSDKTNSELVVYDKRIKGLKVFKPWSGIPAKGNYEIGTKSRNVTLYYPGQYAHASIELLAIADLRKLPNADLQDN
jgi:hypothetical protein